MLDFFHPDIFVKFAAAFVAMTNPLYSVPVFLGMTKDSSSEERRKTAHIIALTVFLTAVVVTLVGEEILAFFGISQPAFQIGGGIIVLLLGLTMLQADATSVADKAQTRGKEGAMSIAVVPLSIPATLGPGGFATIILFAHLLDDGSEVFTMIPVIFMISVLIWLGLIFAVPLSRILGNTAINITTRIMAIILVAVAVEMALNGAVEFAKASFPGIVSNQTPTAQ